MHLPLFRSLRPSALGLVAFVAAVLPPAMSQASEPFLTVPDPAVAESTAAYRYANMTNDEALAELNRRGLPYVEVDPTPGVRAPIRLTGRLHGVLIHSGAAPSQRLTSPFEILDARLALALDDFTALLEKHDIDEIEHFSMYRPGATQKAQNAQKAKEAPPVVAAPAKPAVVPVKPREVVAKPAPAKPAQETGKQTPKPVKVATRGKTPAPRVTPKPPVKPATPQKIVSSAVPKSKPAPAPVAKPKSLPNTKNLGKATLGSKIAAKPGDKGLKHKAPGETEETVQSEKPVEIVTEAQPVKKDEHSQTTTPNTSVQAAGETRHPGGLAIDVGKLHRKDGTWITVAEHFQGKIGERACGADARIPESPEAKELRALACTAMDQHWFTYILTPNYNAAHADHFHMEIKPGVKWFFVH